MCTPIEIKEEKKYESPVRRKKDRETEKEKKHTQLIVNLRLLQLGKIN